MKFKMNKKVMAFGLASAIALGNMATVVATEPVKIEDVKVEEDNFISDNYSFKFKKAPVWKNFVTIEEGEKEVKFIFTPKDKMNKSHTFFTIEMKELGHKLEKDEIDLGKDRYQYLGKIDDKVDYKEGTSAKEDFQSVLKVLDGVDDLFEILEKEYIYKNFGFKLRKPLTWDNFVFVEEIEAEEADDLVGKVKFNFIPKDKMNMPHNFLTIEMKGLNYQVTDGEISLGKGKYQYIAKINDKVDYKEGTSAREDFKSVVEALDGIDDLFSPIKAELEDYFNDKYKFGLKVAPIWDMKVKVQENEDRSEVKFIYMPKDKMNKEFNFFSLKVKPLDYKLAEDETVLETREHQYIVKLNKDIPYEKDSQVRKDFDKVNRVLDGIDDLFWLMETKDQAQEVTNMDKLVINGKEVVLKNKIQKDSQGNLIYPLVEITSELGFKPSWDGKNRIATISKGNLTAGTNVDTKENFYSMARIELESNSTIVKSRTFVPESFFSEVLKAEKTVENGVLNIKLK